MTPSAPMTPPSPSAPMTPPAPSAPMTPPVRRSEQARVRRSEQAPARRSEQGQAALELVALLPMLLFAGLLVFQVGAAMWTLTSTGEAARQAAVTYSRSESLAAAAAAAENSLPGRLDVQSIQDAGRGGHGIRLAVAIPRVLPVTLDPVVREVVMP